MIRAFEQTAEGTFKCRVKPGTPHCGPGYDPNGFDFKYQILIKYDPLALDEHGFLLDNTTFHDYFSRYATQEIEISCEKFACKIADDFAAMATPHILRIEVCMCGVQDVWIKAEWVRPDLDNPCKLKKTETLWTVYSKQWDDSSLDGSSDIHQIVSAATPEEAIEIFNRQAVERGLDKATKAEKTEVWR
jgi:hypothetical protein